MPEQNGVAERANRTLIESARTMMQHAKLPTEFWAEAVSHAATLANITPREGQAKTPQELMWGRKPNVQNMRVFGCESFAHVDRSLRQKFDPTSSIGIFVGFSKESKAFRIFDLQERRIRTTRTATFNEQSFPLASKKAVISEVP